MPGGDRTGPMGGGPMSGWRRGFCSEPEGPRFAGSGYGGRGPGFGRGGGGGGWGWRNRFWATGTPGMMRGAAPPAFAGAQSTEDTERRWLEQRSAALDAEQKQVKTRLGAIDATE